MKPPAHGIASSETFYTHCANVLFFARGIGYEDIGVVEMEHE